MPKPFLKLSIQEFADRLNAFTFTRPISSVHMHHTFIPRQSDFRGVSTINSMFEDHINVRKFADIAQHLSIDPNGFVWTGRDWNRTPASATGFNTGVFMFETIGDFDVGQERLEGAQRRAVIDVIALVQLKCGLPVDSLHFHREFTDQKTCPGTGVRKADILLEVKDARARLSGGTRAVVALTPNVESLPLSRRSTVHPGATATGAPTFGGRAVSVRPFGDAEITRSTGPAAAVLDEEEGEVDCADIGGRDFSLNGSRTRDGGFSPDDLEFLRRHVVNLRQGQFSESGVFETGKADVETMFSEHLPVALADAKRRGERLPVVIYAHGGLVSEESGLAMARACLPWWIKNHVYPIYFVWETGLFETITQLIKGRRELAAARDIFDITDRPIEDLVRSVGGGKIWDGMKLSAQRSVEHDGGARVVAELLAQFCAMNSPDVELHAVGHSAGAIFHSHFIPAALDLNPQPFATVSFLAPAIRVSEFMSRLAPRLDNGIDALTMYTMRKDLERADNCASLYRKSLLYLIHFALEAKRREPILGLEESIRDNPDLKEIFGIGGHATSHDLVFSKTVATSGRSATRSTSHGGFDNDRATLESVVRRILDVSDSAIIEPFPNQVARDFSFDALLAAGDFASGAASTTEADAQPERRPQPAPTSERPEPVRTSAGRVGRKGRLARALCVGINAYPGNARLTGCVNDANDWARALKRLGFEHVDQIPDQEATRERLLRDLRALVRSGRPGESLAFQYAGHGTFFQDEGPRPDEDDGKDEAIVPVDFQDGGRFILDDELFEIFDELQDGVSLTCFFDCCHSGTISRFAIASMVRAARDLRDEEVRPRFLDPTPEMVSEYRQLRADTRGAPKRRLRNADDLKAVVFSACRDDEVALESGGHGAFTKRVAPLLQSAFEAATTNEEFARRIVTAFGAGAAQNPALDCARPSMRWPLFRTAGASAPDDALTPHDGRQVAEVH